MVSSLIVVLQGGGRGLGGHELRSVNARAFAEEPGGMVMLHKVFEEGGWRWRRGEDNQAGFVLSLPEDLAAC